MSRAYTASRQTALHGARNSRSLRESRSGERDEGGGRSHEREARATPARVARLSRRTETKRASLQNSFFYGRFCGAKREQPAIGLRSPKATVKNILWTCGKPGTKTDATQGLSSVSE